MRPAVHDAPVHNSPAAKGLGMNGSGRDGLYRGLFLGADGPTRRQSLPAVHTVSDTEIHVIPIALRHSSLLWVPSQ